MVAGAAYVASCVTSIVFLAQMPVVSRVVMPLYFGELPMVLWLLVMGTKTPPAAEAA